MVVSYGHSLTIRLMTCAFHGERVYSEYLVYRMTLIVIFFRYLVSACHHNYDEIVGNPFIKFYKNMRSTQVKVNSCSYKLWYPVWPP